MLTLLVPTLDFASIELFDEISCISGSKKIKLEAHFNDQKIEDHPGMKTYLASLAPRIDAIESPNIENILELESIGIKAKKYIITLVEDVDFFYDIQYFKNPNLGSILIVDINNQTLIKMMNDPNLVVDPRVRMNIRNNMLHTSVIDYLCKHISQVSFRNKLDDNQARVVTDAICMSGSIITYARFRYMSHEFYANIVMNNQSLTKLRLFDVVPKLIIPILGKSKIEDIKIQGGSFNEIINITPILNNSCIAKFRCCNRIRWAKGSLINNTTLVHISTSDKNRSKHQDIYHKTNINRRN
jgi:hypothetical protein